MTPGIGVITEGDKTLDEYLPQEILRMVVKTHLEVTGTLESYDIKINVYGDGLIGQLVL